MNQQIFYNDHLYKKFRPKADALEILLEETEQKLSSLNQIPSLFNIALSTQDDGWVCGRIHSDNAGGGGKLTPYSTLLQGSYVCSNSKSMRVNLNECPEYSLFPGQIVLARGRNPNGDLFICKEIIEPALIANDESLGSTQRSSLVKKEKLDITELRRDNNVNVRLEANESLSLICASGPYMTNGSVKTDFLRLLVKAVETNKAHVLIMLGPFVDSNHDLISSGNIPMSFDELLQTMLTEVGEMLKHLNVQVVVQPSLNDLTQEPIYPIHPLSVSTLFQKQYNFFHFVPEPSMVRINGLNFAITTTDVVKDLTMISVSKTQSSDRISKNFSHLMRQRSFYPIYPPPDHMPIDFEAWTKYARLETKPDVFIVVSGLATFVKNVNDCVCFNPGRLVKGTAHGTFAKITVKSDQQQQGQKENSSESDKGISVEFQKI